MIPPYDGRHLIADLHDCSGLDDLALVERALRDGAAAAGATVLDVRLHAFGPGQGVTGVALLAESHISIHSWPEHRYAAIDIFLCGRRCDPQAALAVIVAAFGGHVASETVIARGFGVIPAPVRAE
ncbi:adenosylmethionine decarboxylase [Sphingomonas sp. S1-29]|uniref:adenosylmethionine decarboxylase n=1 Tax=Sphingomonas sp. S1-29 TaxID=2991074 RepID=UPI00223EE3A8|nr:adenosylmethionine decarboxylase [Sphingomonas sp. S1-29]UZK68409.1 adenosylmethionine decarboxylase [Sphingomonas sp. S1-29]